MQLLWLEAQVAALVNSGRAVAQKFPDSRTHSCLEDVFESVAAALEIDFLLEPEAEPV